MQNDYKMLIEFTFIPTFLCAKAMMSYPDGHMVTPGREMFWIGYEVESIDVTTGLLSQSSLRAKRSKMQMQRLTVNARAQIM
jgi:hypothetical protein